MKIGVMQGHLRDFDLAQVLQVVGTGRQYTSVEVRDDVAIRGIIYIKAGKVVAVEAEGEAGRPALNKLFRHGDAQFVVSRMQTPRDLPEPLGAVQNLLMEILAERSATPTLEEPEPDTFPERSSPTAAGLGGYHVPLSTPPVAPPVASVPPLAQQTSSIPPHATAPFAGREPLHSLPPGPERVVAVVSPKGGCGKTTIALNLALSLARLGRRVVLLDTDVNGDVLSAIDSRARARFGFYDLLAGEGSVRDALLPTVLPHFKLLPAVGSELPDPERLSAEPAPLRRLLAELAREAEIVVVDTPAGMFGVTHQIARASTHVLGVLQAEQIAGRSFSRFAQVLERVPREERPAVLGVVVNMVQAKHEASLSVLHSACQDFPSEWLFDTSIPRHRAFLDASLAGVPLRHLNEKSPPAVAWLFDTLAAEIAERLKLPEVIVQPQPLLL